jgi:hypothetical protein
MSSPLESPEYGTLYVGDTHDDDAHVIDSLDIEVDAPATPVIEPISPAPLEPLRRNNRLLTGTLTFDANSISPVQILPADPNRKQIRLDGLSFAATPGATDYLAISDDQGKVNTPFTSAWRLRSGKSHTIDNYNGALYVMPGAGVATNAFELTWLSVTE